MNDIYIYTTRLPANISEMVIPCDGGYSVYLDSTISECQRIRAFCHALSHIDNNDFEKADVQLIEHESHNRTEKPLSFYESAFKERLFHVGYIEPPR